VAASSSSTYPVAVHSKPSWNGSDQKRVIHTSDDLRKTLVSEIGTWDMPTLEEVYENRLDEGGDDGYLRVRAGLALLCAGVFLTLLGGVVAFSETVAAVFDAAEHDWQMWGAGAKFAGVGVPLAFAGVFVVVPAPRRDRVLSASGVLTAFVGIALFDYAYPARWAGDPLDLTPLVFGVYALGSFLIFGALFRSVLDVEVTLPRSSVSVEYSDDLPNREERVAEMKGSTTSDGGGGITVDTNADDAEVVHDERGDDTESSGFAGDRYCGNCVFYEYVRNDGDSVPFCNFHDHELDDLEACDEHEMRLGTDE
jgi:hypothetical protein